MIVKLEQDEIRKILAEYLEEKLAYKWKPDPEDCWFEAEAGVIESSSIGDIHNVKFCFQLDSN